MNDIVKHTLQLIQAEERAEELTGTIVVSCSKGGLRNKELIAEFANHVREIGEIRAAFSTHTLNLQYFRAKALVDHLSENFKDAISICDNAIHYLRKNPHLAQKARFLEYYLYKIDAYSALTDYENARFSASVGLRYARRGSHNWFAFQELRFRLAMRTANYGDAQMALQEVRGSSRFEFEQEFRQHQWIVSEAYFLYAAFRRSYVAPEQEYSRCARLLETIPDAVPGNTPLNISILIVRILYNLRYNDRSTVHVLLQKLKKFSAKNLNNPTTRRSQVFIRMLLLIGREEFDSKRIGHLSQRYLKKLHDSTHMADEVEIIPFEKLWGWLMESLQFSGEEGARIPDRRVRTASGQ